MKNGEKKIMLKGGSHFSRVFKIIKMDMIRKPDKERDEILRERTKDLEERAHLVTIFREPEGFHTFIEAMQYATKLVEEISILEKKAKSLDEFSIKIKRTPHLFYTSDPLRHDIQNVLRINREFFYESLKRVVQLYYEMIYFGVNQVQRIKERAYEIKKKEKENAL
jgi:hypothetical protein